MSVGTLAISISLSPFWKIGAFVPPFVKGGGFEKELILNAYIKAGCLYGNEKPFILTNLECSMARYVLWNNKGGVGKSYLSFQIASEYARVNPDQKVLALDLCPQANLSQMLLGGAVDGELHLAKLLSTLPRKTIAGYIEDRLRSPYIVTGNGSAYLIQPLQYNPYIPSNLYLVAGDDELEVKASRVVVSTTTGPSDAWRLVHGWISDLIEEVRQSWNQEQVTVFLDCNPGFGIYTEMALSAADRLIIPFSADGSSKRAVRSLLSLVYGISRAPGAQRSEFNTKTEQYRMALPRIYGYVGNRLTQMNKTSAQAFKSVVQDIGDEIWTVWQNRNQYLCAHPTGAPFPRNKTEFKKMFQYEIPDANTASVVSSTIGVPITILPSGSRLVLGKTVMVNQSQLDKQQPAVRSLVAEIE